MDGLEEDHDWGDDDDIYNIDDETEQRFASLAAK